MKWEETTKKILAAVTVAGSIAFAGAAFAGSQRMTVGMSWSNFEEERWKTDKAATKGALDAVGAGYVSTDAQSSASK